VIEESEGSPPCISCIGFLFRKYVLCAKGDLGSKWITCPGSLTVGGLISD
jgi:hypothetical protein